MSSTLNSTSGETPPTSKAGCKTHSPGLYAKYANKIPKRFNLKALDLLQMCFETRTSNKEQFLDIGCGIGDFTREELLPRCLPCNRLVATDLSEDMLSHAMKNYSHPKIVYDILDIRGDVSGFQQKYGQFERVYSFFCLNWVKDKQVAVNNIWRLLAPGGECILLFVIGGNAFKSWTILGEMERWKSYKKVRTDTFISKQSQPKITTLTVLYDSLHS